MEQSTNPQGIFRSLDWITVVLYLLLLTIGWFSVVGATYNFGDPLVIDYTTRAGKQLLWIGLALVWAFVLMFVDDRIYDTFSYIFYIFMMGILLITPFISQGHKGSYSWIDIGSVSLQPAEFAKTATALALAKLMGSYGFSLFRPRNFLLALALVLIPMALIIRQRETGSALVYLAFFLVFYREGMSGSVLFVAFSAVVYFIVGLRYDADPLPHTLSSVGQFSVLVLVWVFTVLLSWIYDRNKLHALHMALGGLVLLGSAYAVSRFIVPFDIAWVALGVCLGCVAYIVVQAIRTRVPRLLLMALFGLGSLTVYYSADYALNNLLEPHQQDRVRVLIGLEEDLIKAGYNVNQSKIAIGSGGFWGKGFLNGTQTKLKYVPEQDTDFIFCTIGEEMGFIGSAAVLFLFLAIILRLIHLAERQRYSFGRVYGYCVLSILLFHVFINVGMVLGLTPVIGIPLPFFSYGGSSLWGFTLLLFIFLRIDAGRNRFGYTN
ncbi:MAG: rod shape-determining protein RodA [Bacteroidaceae bacterium]|nr:rod shape-determining protein RodA [Bacteroidaceae bacterium]